MEIIHVNTSVGRWLKVDGPVESSNLYLPLNFIMPNESWGKFNGFSRTLEDIQSLFDN